MKRCSGPLYLVEGRLVNASGEYCWTDKVFTDGWQAQMYLITVEPDDARLFGAWVSFDFELQEGYDGHGSARTVRCGNSRR